MFFGYCFCSLYALNKNWKELTLSQTSLSLYILAHSSVSRSPNFISCPRSPEAYIRRLVYLGRNRWLLYISANVVPKLANVWIYRRQSFQGLPESPNQRIVYRLWGEGWRIWVIFGFSDWQKRGSVIPESSRGGITECHMPTTKHLTNLVPRAFSLKIVEEKALGTRLTPDGRLFQVAL